MRLSNYLKRHKITAAALARRVGVSKQAVSCWLSGARTPNSLSMRRILVATGGEVKANDFFSPADAA